MSCVCSSLELKFNTNECFLNHVAKTRSPRGWMWLQLKFRFFKENTGVTKLRNSLTGEQWGSYASCSPIHGTHTKPLSRLSRKTTIAIDYQRKCTKGLLLKNKQSPIIHLPSRYFSYFPTPILQWKFWSISFNFINWRKKYPSLRHIKA